jgi:hypothetical protein
MWSTDRGHGEKKPEIDKKLTRFNIGEDYVRWALDTLKSEAERDGVVHARIDQDVKREQAKIKDELAELNRFIIKQERTGWTLMSKEEVLAEKQRLVAELKRLDPEESKNDTANDGLDETSGALDYACYARFWLKEGSPDQKREVFAALGSNLKLKDKKLSIDLLPERRSFAVEYDRLTEGLEVLASKLATYRQVFREFPLRL